MLWFHVKSDMQKEILWNQSILDDFRRSKNCLFDHFKRQCQNSKKFKIQSCWNGQKSSCCPSGISQNWLQCNQITRKKILVAGKLLKFHTVKLYLRYKPFSTLQIWKYCQNSMNRKDTVWKNGKFSRNFFFVKSTL